jgi:ketosteroid isomerase-like protein
MTEESSALAARVERLESIDEIKTLVARYAELIDRRDIDALVQLYVEDVPVGRKVGREALARSFRRVLGPDSPFRVTIHFVGAHTVQIDASDPDRASGHAYCRAEHEVGDKWVAVVFQYFDSYARRDGRWLIQDRVMKAFYGADVLERPNGDERMKHQILPGGLMATAELPESEPTWTEFWASFPSD